MKVTLILAGAASVLIAAPAFAAGNTTGTSNSMSKGSAAAPKPMGEFTDKMAGNTNGISKKAVKPAPSTAANAMGPR